MRNRRAVGLLNPMRDKKVKGQEPEGRRDDTCDHGLSRSWKVKVWKKKKKNMYTYTCLTNSPERLGRADQSGAARSKSFTALIFRPNLLDPCCAFQAQKLTKIPRRLQHRPHEAILWIAAARVVRSVFWAATQEAVRQKRVAWRCSADCLKIS